MLPAGNLFAGLMASYTATAVLAGWEYPRELQCWVPCLRSMKMLQLGTLSAVICRAANKREQKEFVGFGCADQSADVSPCD